MASRLHVSDANSDAVRKRIEAHKFENEEGEEYKASHFGGFTDYFRRKKIKLQNLDADLRSSSADNSSIFRGVVAHVNGYTQPSLNDLHKTIVTHGGGFLQYLDGKTTVTHIIASSLTPKKRIEFRRYRTVKPAWVVESVRAGKLLPWDSFRVLDEGVGQHVLGFDGGRIVSQTSTQQKGYRDQTDTSWYTSQVQGLVNDLSPDADDKPFPSTQLASAEHESSSPKTLSSNPTKSRSSVPYDSPFTRRAESLQQLARDADSTDRSPLEINADISTEYTGHSNASPSRRKERTTSDLGLIEHGAPNGNSAFLQEVEGDTTLSHRIGSPNREVKRSRSPDAHSPSKKAKLTAEEHNAALLADPRVRKSTVVNPDFLKQYYQESRLHHLSTWKADLKLQLQQLLAEKSPSQQVRQKRAPGTRRYILHVDFDSFFAAVSLKKVPQYVDKPSVVAHGGGSGSEIASCNYAAREFGIKNGMWMKRAQELCPDLKVLPYDFKAYEEASRNFYDAILATGGIVQSVSVDEALVDVTELCLPAGGSDGKGVREGNTWREQAKADQMAQGLRDIIKEKTGCAVSVGIGGNILLAKVALRRAKPAGQYHIKPEAVLDFIGELTVQELPGVAHSLGGKLEELGVKFVKDIRGLTKERLMSTLGPKTGEKLWDYSRGIDRSEVWQQVVRKSVSAEVNWGVRFETQAQAEEFVQNLCGELHRRLVDQKVKGRQLTMKIMRRASDAPLDPPKHLGHGKCDTYNKSVVLGVATNAQDVIAREALSILRGFGFSPGELRGLGIQMTKLETSKAYIDGETLSSQKRLQFGTKKPEKENKETIDPIVDDIESPQNPRIS
ncbi:MAG: deoxycytidyl transferase, partial [Candelina submexicana]